MWLNLIPVEYIFRCIIIGDKILVSFWFSEPLPDVHDSLDTWKGSGGASFKCSVQYS